MKPSVVIIGGGLAGLTAAHYLNKSSQFEITILEKLDRLGGRVLSFEYKGKQYDHGGFMIMPVQMDYTNHSSIFIKTNQILKIKNGSYWTVSYVPLAENDSQGIVSIYNLHNQESNLYQIFFNHQKEFNNVI